MAVYKTVQGLVHNYGGLLGTHSPFLIPFLAGCSHSTDSHSLDARYDGSRSVPGCCLLPLLVHPIAFFWFTHIPLTFSRSLSTAGTSAPNTAFVLAVFYSAATLSGAFGGLLAVRAPISRRRISHS
jgi:hypothetical protein